MSAYVPAEAGQYRYTTAHQNTSHAILLPELQRLLRRLLEPGSAVFEVGAGNGSVGRIIAQQYHYTGIEPSAEGVQQSGGLISPGSGYDDLASEYGQFDLVFSLEVIEHVYAPRLFAQRCFDLVRPGGHIIISTPYHGYVKNVAIALAGKTDRHADPLWDHGHIKFWSIAKLSSLLNETGFDVVEVTRVGRVPVLAKSMFMVAKRPAHSGA